MPRPSNPTDASRSSRLQGFQAVSCSSPVPCPSSPRGRTSRPRGSRRPAPYPRPEVTSAVTSHTFGEQHMPTRNASATWEGGLKGGKGSFKGESGAINATYSFGTRFENEKGSNPEELLAAAEAACFSMALALGLEKAGTPSRSEEHTSELQSPCNLVCRLLLEK